MTATKYGVVTERNGQQTVLIDPSDPQETELTGGRFFIINHQGGAFILAAELLAKYHVLVKEKTFGPKGGSADIVDDGSY